MVKKQLCQRRDRVKAVSGEVSHFGGATKDFVVDRMVEVSIIIKRKMEDLEARFHGVVREEEGVKVAIMVSKMVHLKT